VVVRIMNPDRVRLMSKGTDLLPERFLSKRGYSKEKSEAARDARGSVEKHKQPRGITPPIQFK